LARLIRRTKSSEQAITTALSCLERDGADHKSAEVLPTPPSTDNCRASFVIPDLHTRPANYQAMLELSYAREMKDDIDESESDWSSDDESATSSEMSVVDLEELEEFRRQVCEDLKKSWQMTRDNQLAKTDRGFARLAVIEEEEEEDGLLF